jgi:predicted AlkP superfamily pyrophosphatase or phosphodiesterase
VRNVVRSLVPLLVLVLAASSIAAPPKKSAAAPKAALPKLVLQITVDQLRGDLPLRYQDRFGARGFRYLLEHGTWYTAAHHPHSFTETIVGHTTLATGAYPSRHGMIANNWLDRAGNKVSNIETTAHPLVGTKSKGASPERILSSTLSDELNLATAGRAKVFAVSYKDRGAVPMAGHAGKAFWFKNGCFVSSTFYYSAYPAWRDAWCKGAPADVYKGKEWTLLQDRSRYVQRDRENRFPDDTPPEDGMELLDTMGFGRSFPHRLVADDSFLTLLSITPYQDELTLDFTKALITSESLGKDAIPDYLGVSFSSTDLIAHWFSHSSIESEDNLLRLDRTLEALFAFIDKEVGLANTLIVLSADHGGTEFPELLATLQVPTGRVTPEKLNEVVTAALDARYGAGHGFIGPYQDPYFWLNDAAIEAKKADPREIEKIVTAALLTVPGVAFAIPTQQLHAVPGIDEPLLLAIQRNHHAERSGDIYVVEQQNWQIQPADESLILLQHNAPWAYDTHVPVAFAGAGVPARRVSRAVSTVDVAATLAVMLRTRAPSGSVGVPLTEVVDK